MFKHTPEPWTWRDCIGAGIQISGTLPSGFKFDHTCYGADGSTSFMTYTMREDGHAVVADARWVQFETKSWQEMQEANAERIVSCVNALKGIKNPAVIPELLTALKWDIRLLDWKSENMDAEFLDSKTTDDLVTVFPCFTMFCIPLKYCDVQEHIRRLLNNAIVYLNKDIKQ